MTLLACLLALPVAVLTAPAAHACSCDRPERESALESEVIAEVLVEGEERVGHDRVYDLHVVRRWSGSGPSSVRLTTGGDVTACGLQLVEGERYLLFAHERDGGGWQSSWCTATSGVGAEDPVVTRADIEERHGTGMVPVPASDHVVSADAGGPVPWLLLAGLAAAVLALLGGGRWLLRGRSG
jgi:hypothetical protein